MIRVTADSDYSKVVSHAIGDGCGPIFGQTNEVFLGPKINQPCISQEEPTTPQEAVSYTHLTLPTNREV